MAAFIIAFHSWVVFGAVIDSVVTQEIAGNTEKQNITITGVIPLPQNSSVLDRQVTLEVLNPGVTKANMAGKPKN